MICKATMTQTAYLLKKKEAVCVFYVLFSMVIMNFIGNVLDFQGRDIAEMYHPMKLLLLSYNRTNWNATNTLLLIQLYPLLVACPAGFSLAREYQRGTRVFMVSRLGNHAYLVSKYLAAFLTTMIVFTVPFLLEIVLNCVSFPLSAAGDLSNSSIYEGVSVESPYLHAVMGTLLWGIVSGLFGVFTVAASSLIRVKYNVFLLLPVFVALNLSNILAGRLPKDAPSIRWYDYVLFFHDEPQSRALLLTGVFALVLFSIGAVCVSGRKDCL